MEAVTETSGAQPSAKRSTRRIAVATALAAAAAISLSSCAAGQHAATAVDKPAIAGTGGSVGTIDLLDVSVQAPNVPGRDTGSKYYVVGDNAPLTITLVNTGHAADTLTSVTSTSFASWQIVSTPLVTEGSSASGGSTSQVIAPQSRVALGLSNLGIGSGESADTLLMTGLQGNDLYPGSVIPITFTFANAGSVTLNVPVDLTSSPTTGSVPPLPGDSGA